MSEEIRLAKPGLGQTLNREDLRSDSVTDPIGGTRDTDARLLSLSLALFPFNSKITTLPLV